MRRLLAIAAFFALALVPLSAFASGPSMHMREADRFITVLELQPQSGIPYEPDFLRRDRRFLILGSIWPDVGRLLPAVQDGRKVDEGSVDPHNRHFVAFMLDDALADYDANPWKVPFALGNLAHCASDAVTQGMFVQHQAVRAGFGELDVAVGLEDDHPGGENEAVIEGGMEFMAPAFGYYLEMVDDFLLSADGRVELAAALAFFSEEWAAYFGADQESGGWPVLVDALTDFPTRFPPCAPGAPAELVQFGRSGFVDFGPLDALSIDWDELLRFITGPAGSRAFWDDYYDEGFYQLSPTMLRSFHDGQPFFDNFPNWRALMMKAGVIQSLNEHLTGAPEGDDGRFLMALDWLAEGSTPVMSIDADAPPASVTLRAVLYETPGRTTTGDVVALRVREDSVDAPLLAYVAADVHVDPWRYDQIGPAQLEVAFDPSVAIGHGAAGLFAELAYGDDPETPAYFTTNWAVYEQIEDLDMTKDCYTLNYAAYGKEPYSLAISYGEQAALSPPPSASGFRLPPGMTARAARPASRRHFRESGISEARPARRAPTVPDAALAGHWTALPPLPAGRVDPAAVVANDGAVYVVGGTDRHTTFVNGWKLMPDGGSWAPIADAVLPVSQANVAWHDGQLFVAGGIDAAEVRTFVQSYDPELDAWEVWSTLQEPRYGGRLVSTGDRLFQIGGGDEEDEPQADCSEGLPPGFTWIGCASMAQARKHHGAATIDGKIYVYGGVGIDGDAPVHLASAEVYDPEADQWTALPDLPATWWGGASGARGGKAFACGGVQNGAVSAACFVFDPSKGAWSAGEDVPFAAVRSGSGGQGLVVVGGERIDDRGHTVLTDAAIWTESADDDDDDDDDDNDDDSSPTDDDDDDDNDDDSSPGDDDDDDNDDNDNDDNDDAAPDDDDNDDDDDDNDSGSGCGC